MTGASPTATGLSSLRDEAAVASSPKASIPSAEALVQMMVDWGIVPKAHFHKRYPFLESLRTEMAEEYVLDPKDIFAKTLFAFTELAERLDAQGIETRSAKTEGLGPEDESAVLKGCAQDSPPEQSSKGA